jgi:hypothetical protein
MQRLGRRILGEASTFRHPRRVRRQAPGVDVNAPLSAGPGETGRRPLPERRECVAGACHDSGWLALLLVPYVAVLRVGVIAREERYLERKFGQRYRAYRARVRRWL